MAHFCGKCGTKLTEGQLFCPECSAAIPAAFDEPEEFAGEVRAVIPPAQSTEIPEFMPIPAPPDPIIEQVDAPADALETAGAEEITVISEPAADNAPPAHEPPPPLSKGKRVLFTVLSVLVSAVLFTAITAGQAAVISRATAEPATIQAFVRAAITDANINIGDFRVGEYIRDMDVNIPDFERRAIHDGQNSAFLYEVVYNSLHDYYMTAHREEDAEALQPQDVRRILSNPAFNSFAANIAANGVDYLMTGSHRNAAIVNVDEIVRLMATNARSVEEITGFPFNANAEYALILRETLSRAGGIADMRWSDLDNADTRELNLIRSIISAFERWTILALIGAIILVAGLTAGLIALNRRRKTDTLFYFGIPVIVAGLAKIVISFFVGRILRYAATQSGLTANAFAQPLANTELINNIFFAGLTVLITGVLLVAARIVIGVLRKRRRVAAV
jgi:hypothetical protein